MVIEDGQKFVSVLVFIANREADALRQNRISGVEMGKMLRRIGWLAKSTKNVTPRIRAIRAGYMQVIERPLKNGMIKSQGRITPSGFHELSECFKMRTKLEVGAC